MGYNDIEMLKEIRKHGLEPDGFTVVSMWQRFNPNFFLPENIKSYPMSQWGKIGLARSESAYFFIIDRYCLIRYFIPTKD